jgi:pimeloyl-ACP methyl ester carboxylesterase
MRGEFVDVGGARLYYFASGSRGAGEPVVFLHGFPATAHLWARVLPLMPAGHRLVVVDALGSGRSDRADGRSLDLVAHTARFLTLLDDLRIDHACLVGHGFGGAIAQSVALASPARISRLALIDSVAFDAWPASLARVARLVARAPALARALGAPLLASLVHGSALRGFRDADVGRYALDQFLHHYPARLGVDTLIAQLRAQHDPHVASYGERLGTLRLPATVMTGSDDPFIPRAIAERLAATIPGATLDVVEGARHFVPEDSPERVAAALRALLSRPL